MDNCLTPLPRPKLDLFNDYCLTDNKVYKRKDVTPATKSCPRGPPKSREHAMKSRLALFHRNQSGGCWPNPGYRDKDHRPPRLVTFRPRKAPTREHHNLAEDVEFKKTFIIRSKLGAGSFGEVYEGEDRETGQRFAIKKSREKFRSENHRKKKLSEVRKYEAIHKHVNCVEFYEAWEELGFLFIKTELCLTTLIHLADKYDECCLPELEVFNVLVDMLSALSHLKSLNLIHMDIKPANIFLGSDKWYKLGDFGLIIDTLNRSTDDQEGDAKYLAPEVFENNFTHQADIFSLGASLLECATDIELPSNGSEWHLLRSDFTKFHPGEFQGLSSKLYTLLCAMMRTDPAKRISLDELWAHETVFAAKKKRNANATKTFIEGSPMKRLCLQDTLDRIGDSSASEVEAGLESDSITPTWPSVATHCDDFEPHNTFTSLVMPSPFNEFQTNDSQSHAVSAAAHAESLDAPTLDDTVFVTPPPTPRRLSNSSASSEGFITLPERHDTLTAGSPSQLSHSETESGSQPCSNTSSPSRVTVNLNSVFDELGE